MTDDVLVPLFGFVRGDTLGVLVLVHAQDSIATLAASLQHRRQPIRSRVRNRRGDAQPANEVTRDGGLGDPVELHPGQRCSGPPPRQ